jgi:ABC-type lipoprotein release transport system permease subunit
MPLAAKVFFAMKTFLLWTSPLILLEGILLLLTKEDKYRKLEEKLGKEVGGIKKRVVPWLETNNYAFQNWLLKRKLLLGIVFVVYALMLFWVLRK